MSNRCPSCNHFASFEPVDPEVSDYSVNSAGTVTVEVRLALACAECGDEGKETTFEFDTVPDGLEDHIEEHEKAGTDFELDFDEPDFSYYDRFQNTDKNGKPIKSIRYMKHYHGVEGTGSVICSCGKSFEVTFSDEVQASSMDDLW